MISKQALKKNHFEFNSTDPYTKISYWERSVIVNSEIITVSIDSEGLVQVCPVLNRSSWLSITICKNDKSFNTLCSVLFEPEK